eukprot:5777179-Pleurochrysis_carterae.AAC.2
MKHEQIRETTMKWFGPPLDDGCCFTLARTLAINPAFSSARTEMLAVALKDAGSGISGTKNNRFRAFEVLC